MRPSAFGPRPRRPWILNPRDRRPSPELNLVVPLFNPHRGEGPKGGGKGQALGGHYFACIIRYCSANSEVQGLWCKVVHGGVLTATHSTRCTVLVGGKSSFSPMHLLLLLLGAVGECGEIPGSSSFSPMHLLLLLLGAVGECSEIPGSSRRTSSLPCANLMLSLPQRPSLLLRAPAGITAPLAR